MAGQVLAETIGDDQRVVEPGSADLASFARISSPASIGPFATSRRKQVHCRELLRGQRAAHHCAQLVAVMVRLDPSRGLGSIVSTVCEDERLPVGAVGPHTAGHLTEIHLGRG